MKILITYFSQTGNTEKIANAMKDGLERHDVEMQKVADTPPESLKNYDVVFLGSGIYGGRIKKEIADIIKKAEELAPKFVFFCTHASPSAYQKAFRRVRKKIEELNSEVIGEWDCRGENIGIPKEKTQAMLDKLPPAQREKAAADQEALKGHPDEGDLEKAKKFVQSIIKE